jgi:RNA exonuclease 1
MNHTRAETSTDGRRVAHQPKVQSTLNNSSFKPLLQPLVDPNSSVNKIPFKTRQEYLTFFLNELKKRSSNTNDLTPTTPVFSRAQTIEKEIFDKSTNKNSYLNLAAKYLRQLRSEETTNQTKAEQISPKKSNAQRLVVSHSAMLTGGKIDNLSFGIKKHKEIDIKTLTGG